MINKRIFGSDIPDKVKHKLKLRQLLAKTDPSVHESVQTLYDNSDYMSDFDGILDLSSRTPFVRMWVGVEIFDRETDEDGKAVNEESLAKRIYVVGNHVLNQSTANPNESVGTPSDQSGTDTTLGLENDDIIPPEFGTNDNQYLKPPAGITSFTSTTEGTLGVMKKTTVGFTVHNFHDFDKIYQRYFLRPAAQIFVDYGWNTGVLYDPTTVVFKGEKPDGEETATGLSVEEILYGEKDKGDKVNGYITEAQGDLETLFGYVSNYDAKILENGSVECSVEISSKNVAILGERFTDSMQSRAQKARLQFTLDHEIESAGISFLTKKGSKARKEILNDLANITITTREEFLARQDTNTEQLLKFFDYKLNDVNLKTGVAIDRGSHNKTATFISWGLFEDFVLNPEFGFGVDLKSINSGTDTEIRIDSSQSFTTFDKLLNDRQAFVGEIADEDLSFLYPSQWDDNTFSINVNKRPSDHNYDKNFLKVHNGSKTQYDKDLELPRVPLREMFIDTSILVEAVKSSKGMVNLLQSILDKINDNSSDIFDWGISNNGSDNIISIIDRNQLGIGGTGTDQQQIFDDLFTFNVMSSNSIVKGYDVSFAMPEGNMGNMLAIQGMSGDTDSKIFNVSSLLDTSIALEALATLSKQPVQQQKTEFFTMGVGYYPNMGSYKAKKLYNDTTTVNAKVSHVYDRLTNFLNNNSGLSGPIDSTSEFGVGTEEASILQLDNFIQSYVGKTITPAQIEPGKSAYLTHAGGQAQIEVAKVNTITDYFGFQASRRFLTHKKSTPLPLTLSLTIYGITSILPGDIFKVDYLPESYKQLVYFQVMKVTQNIDSSGWYTTLETHYRLKQGEKIHTNSVDDTLQVIMDSTSIAKYSPIVKGHSKTISSPGSSIVAPAVITNDESYQNFLASKRTQIGFELEEVDPYMKHKGSTLYDATAFGFRNPSWKFTANIETSNKVVSFNTYGTPFTVFSRSGHMGITPLSSGTQVYFNDEDYNKYLELFPLQTPAIPYVPQVGDQTFFYSKLYHESTKYTTAGGFIPMIQTVLEHGVDYIIITGQSSWMVIPEHQLIDDKVGMLKYLNAFLNGDISSYKPPKRIAECNWCTSSFNEIDYPDLHKFYAWGGIDEIFQKKVCEGPTAIRDGITHHSINYLINMELLDSPTMIQYCKYEDLNKIGTNNTCTPIESACWE